MPSDETLVTDKSNLVTDKKSFDLAANNQKIGSGKSLADLRAEAQDKIIKSNNPIPNQSNKDNQSNKINQADEVFNIVKTYLNVKDRIRVMAKLTEYFNPSRK